LDPAARIASAPLRDFLKSFSPAGADPQGMKRDAILYNGSVVVGTEVGFFVVPASLLKSLTWSP
jgi:hypothetical protein